MNVSIKSWVKSDRLEADSTQYTLKHSEHMMNSHYDPRMSMYLLQL